MTFASKALAATSLVSIPPLNNTRLYNRITPTTGFIHFYHTHLYGTFASPLLVLARSTFIYNGLLLWFLRHPRLQNSIIPSAGFIRFYNTRFHGTFASTLLASTALTLIYTEPPFWFLTLTHTTQTSCPRFLLRSLLYTGWQPTSLVSGGPPVRSFLFSQLLSSRAFHHIRFLQDGIHYQPIRYVSEPITTFIHVLLGRFQTITTFFSSYTQLLGLAIVPDHILFGSCHHIGTLHYFEPPRGNSLISPSRDEHTRRFSHILSFLMLLNARRHTYLQL